MNIIEWVVWGIGILIIIVYIPLYFHPDRLIGLLFRIFAILITIGLVITALTQYSKLHLLWWIPVSFILKDIIFQANLTLGFNKFVKTTDREWEKQLNQDNQ